MKNTCAFQPCPAPAATECGGRRHRLSRRFSAASVFVLLMVFVALAQTDSTQTMRPVIRGRHAAIASMKAEATEAARRILDAGGNAFDAAVFPGRPPTSD